MVKKQALTVVLIVLFVGTSGAFAEPQTGVATQDPQQLKEQFAEAQQQNKEALLAYTWQSRTEIKLKGESKNVKVEQVRYDLDGSLQKTAIAGTGEQ